MHNFFLTWLPLMISRIILLLPALCDFCYVLDYFISVVVISYSVVFSSVSFHNTFILLSTYYY